MSHNVTQLFTLTSYNDHATNMKLKLRNNNDIRTKQEASDKDGKLTVIFDNN